MTKKWLIRFVAILMAVVLVLSVLYVAVSSFSAFAVTQSQINNLKRQQQEYEKKKAEIQSQINSLEYQQSSALAKKEVLDTQIKLTQDQIDNISEQIDEYTQLIVDKQNEVIQAQATEEAQWALYKVRMRTMEENGTISYISVIFNANSFSDLLARIDVVGEIMQYDENLYQQYRDAKQATIQAKLSLEAAKAEQEADRADLQVKQTELQTQLAAADALLKEIENNIDAARELYQQEKEAADNIQADINKKIEELKKQESTVVNGTGKLIWPTPSCMIVTSPFGRRQHPIYGDYRMHYGIDIGAKYGANILAADTGTVIISEYSSSYGNYVVISHGSSVTTLYAHMSSRLVKVGEKVNQGDVIGKVGSTGASTGPHLHFEVSANGSRVNPLNYYSGYTKQGW